MRRLILLALSAASLNSFAQMSNQLGQFDLVPQRVYANPAFQPKAKLNIAFPALGNIYVQHGNNWIKPGEFVNPNSTILSPESILNAIEDDATTTQMLNIELFHAGLRFGKNFLHLRAAERIQFQVGLPTDLFRLAFYGNVGDYEFENSTADFSNLSFDAMHYREYAVGFSRSFTDRLNVGITAKYLYGMEVIETETSSLKLRTDPNTYALTSSGQFDLNTAGINQLAEGEELEISDYLLGKNNTGVAFDFGATYEPIDRLEVQFSAIDIGFISWKDDVRNYQTNDASFLYDGVDISEFLFAEDLDFNDEFENETEELLDELESTFGYQETEEVFNTGINGFLRYGASYQILDNESFRGTGWASLIHGVGEGLVEFQYSAGYNQTVWNSIQAGLHFTKTKDLPFTFGGGLSLNGGFFQVYAMVENLSVAPLAEVTITDSDDPSSSDTFVLPRSAADLRVHVGINFTFNRKFE